MQIYNIFLNTHFLLKNSCIFAKKEVVMAMAKRKTVKKSCGDVCDKNSKPTVSHQKAIDEVRKNKNIVSSASSEELFKKLEI